MVAGAIAFGPLPSASAAVDPCGAGGNPITCENSKPGNPPSEWDVSDAGDPSIQGFTTQISVNPSDTVHFKVKTDATAYSLKIYRLGYYGDDGARLVATVTPDAALPQTQPACLSNPTTGLIDCGNWAESAAWAVPADAVSGVYFARLERTDTGGASHVPFVVRDDSSHSDLVFQTSDTTWQAYNSYGGNSLYECTVDCPSGRPKAYKSAYKVSYNRPWHSRADDFGHNQVFSAEWPMIKFLERNGYDLSYMSGVDTDRDASLLLQHKVFLSVGHDEYWTAKQRQNVEAARDSGVNLAFFSANTMFWKTRWEPSIDGTSTDHRTLVSYKETHFDAKVDPIGPETWTGTWRDTRFSPPADAEPENGLIGTMYVADPPATFPLNISGRFAGLRFWRNTAVAGLAPSESLELSAGSLGYEYDGDVDNDSRPPGLIRLSEQTHNIPAKMLDQGNTTGQGDATHNMTLYRAPSGALVFGAGTVQWSWGLDVDHDGATSTEDPAMQQATVNLFADMGVQPATLMTGLVPATASTDSTAPTTTITASAVTPVVASPYTLSGTAVDAGGVVAGVEVSVDGGGSWHAATGTSSWTYTFTPSSTGSLDLLVRAMDDSGNIEGAPKSTTVTVGPRSCPCSLFGDRTPMIEDSMDANPYELGMRFRSTIDGVVTGVRFYKSAANTGTHTGSLWSNSGAQLATGTFTNETATGWQTLTFAEPVAITADTTYVVSYFTPSGHYGFDPSGFLGRAEYSAPLLGLPDGLTGSNGVFRGTSSGFPTDTNVAGNYWVDVVFNGDTSTDTGPPSVLAVSPAGGSSSQPLSTTIIASFSRPIAASSLDVAVTVAGSPVPGVVALDRSGLIATFTPSEELSSGVVVSVSVNASSTSGVAMPSSYDWSFRTGAVQAAPGDCPCTIWSDLQQPSLANANDTLPVELGVKIVPSEDGWISGVRFFKGSRNTGRHVGTIWSAGGTKLATATFAGESTSGWQQVALDPPVRATAGTTYVVSYHTNVGQYAFDPDYFASEGRSYGPLTAPSTADSGGNGVYAYSSTTTFPAEVSPRAANYWVDAVFETTEPAPLPPSALTQYPADGDVGVAFSAPARVVFTKDVAPASLELTLTAAGGATVAGTVSYDQASKAATFTPSGPLDAGTTYSAGARATGTDGTVMTAPTTWSFTTGNVAACPCSLWQSTDAPALASAQDSNPYELGVRFRSDISGYVTGVRFYKGAANTGTHTGSLWAGDGTRLATGTFSDESATGWQTLVFDAPVAIDPGTDYVASYHTANGGYAYTSNYFTDNDRNAAPLHALGANAGVSNGVYKVGASGFPTVDGAANGSYWVDAVFATTAEDTRPPTISSTTPSALAEGVAKSAPVSAVFSEPVDPATVAFSLDAGGDGISGAVSYDSATLTATFTPATPLSPGTTYTATVSATDVAGNAMASPYAWSFTTVSLASCPCTLLDGATPVNLSANASDDLELGVRFSSAAGGQVTAVKFYKSPVNTGTHTGTLWTTAGEVLATGTFTDETASGWQTLVFPEPVTIQADTEYVASYHAPNGQWSWARGFYDNGLSVPPLSATAPNGVFRVGAGFPTQSANNTNYYVDVVVEGGDADPPAVVATAPASASTTADATAAVTASFSEAIDPATLAFELTGAAGADVPAATTYDSASRTATLTPSTPLEQSATHTATVSAADPAGNAMSTGYSWSFTVADTSPPAVSAVTATGSDTTATVSWSTDEPSGSTVRYGTSADALTSSADGAGSVTSHSVTLTGLKVNTRYYYRVRSVDAAGNTTTSPAAAEPPAEYVPTVTPLSQTTSDDFDAGTLSSVHVSSRSGGEVQLDPTGLVQEFSGTAQPSGWTSDSLESGSSVTVSDGTASVSGRFLRTTSSFPHGRELDAVVTLRPVEEQWFGLTNGDFVAPTDWAAFRTDDSGELVAQTRLDGSGVSTTELSSVGLGVPHRFEIDWTATAVTYSVDGVVVATHDRALTTTLYVAARDATVDTGPIELDSVWLTPYSSSGTFTSSVLDAGATVDWDTFSPTASTPTGTAVTYQVRRGPSSVPDASWTGWTTVTAGADLAGSSRYLQYRATLTSSSTRTTTPSLTAAEVAFAVH